MDLNPQQQAAVDVDATHVWVVAGAGSGKTRVLTERITRLVNQGLDAHDIRAVTFTNKAAREMKERLEKSLGHAAYGLSVGTFHGLCHRWLRRHHAMAGLPEGFILFDDEDQQRLVKQLVRDQGWDDKEWPARMGVSWISRQKDDGHRATDVRPKTPEDRQWLTIYGLYEDRCTQLGAVDFGELLLRTWEVLRDNPEVAQAEQARYAHVLVDEFQDTNRVQYELLRMWVGPKSWLFAVGDADQAIYGWRGARTENIQNLRQDFTPLATVTLAQNYRSTQAILSAANHIIRHNTDRDDKELWTQAGPGNPVKVFTVADEVDEAKVVAAMAREWLQRGYLAERFAILYRNNAQSRALEEQLMAHRIAYTVYGGQRFFDRKEVKDAMGYLRLAANRHDDLAFQRVFNTPTRGLGAVVEEALNKAAVATGSLWRAAQHLLDTKSLTARQSSSLREFMDVVEEADNQPSLMASAEVAIVKSGLRAWYAKDKAAQEEGRLENLDELVSVASRYSDQGSQATLVHFVADAVLEHDQGQQGQGIQMMTIHAAKGLEFSWVCLPGWENGIFPTQRALEGKDIDEERRLAYVAMTRAEHQAVVLHAMRRRWYGRYVDQSPSRFLLDLPPNEVQHQPSPMAALRRAPSPWRHRR